MKPSLYLYTMYSKMLTHKAMNSHKYRIATEFQEHQIVKEYVLSTIAPEFKKIILLSKPNSGGRVGVLEFQVASLGC